MPAAHGLYLAQVWTRPEGDGFQMSADPRLQLSSPVRYSRAQVEEAWSKLRIPVQLLYGSDSEHGGESQQHLLERFRAMVPGADIQCVAPAGHLLLHEQPRQTAAHIVRFAAAAARTSGG